MWPDIWLGEVQHCSVYNGLHLNSEKTEIVEMLRSKGHECDQLHLPDHTVETIPIAVCLGQVWSEKVSANKGV